MSSHLRHERSGHTVLLGGLGGDSHSVGLTILRQALAANGYRVRYLGTQNRLEDFFCLAGLCNVVMISSMDGHARYYLREFPNFRRRFATNGTLWYLGGNLHIGEGHGREREFVEMGFHRVFVKFVDLTTLLELLARDLSSVEAVADCPTLREQASGSARRAAGHAAQDAPLAAEAFERDRREVLEHWGTGPAAKELEANALFISAQPSFARAQAAAKSAPPRPIVQPRCGVPVVGEQRLVAYVVTAPPERPTLFEEIRIMLRQQLPEYMLPAALAQLDALPLNANGKIDRDALPEPESRGRDVEAPATPTEREVARIWAEVLEVHGVGREEDFFELGGHSLLAAQVTTRVRAAFGIELAAQDLFEHPTVADFAEHIDTIRWTAQGLEAPAVAAAAGREEGEL
jgi:methylmalonyl-CoA mutase cobalamin-binding subunit/acyl carrier protein